MRQPWHTAVERRIRRFPLTFYAGGVLLLTLLGTLGLIQPARTLERAWLEAGFLHARVPPLFQSTGGRVDELAFHFVGQTAPAAAPGLLRRHRAGVPDHGGGADHVDQPEGSRSARRKPGDSLPGQSRPEPSLRLVDRFPGRAGAEPGQTTPCCFRLREAGVEMLNAKYQSDRPNIFFLFHRPRRWNKVEGLWMGYERKRGKLTEFNALLRGGLPGLLFPRSSATLRFCRPSNLSLPSTPTRNSLAMPPANSPAPWRIR